VARVPVRLVAKDLRHAACVFGEEAVTAAVLYAFELPGTRAAATSTSVESQQAFLQRLDVTRRPEQRLPTSCRSSGQPRTSGIQVIMAAVMQRRLGHPARIAETAGMLPTGSGAEVRTA
jgi:hypothetical protein